VDTNLQHRKAWKKVLVEHQKTSADTSNFCIAPFIHMYVHGNEGQRVCCMSTENTLVTDDTELDLKKRWSNDYYKEFRKKFLRNEAPEVCVKCYDLEKAGGKSDRMNFNDTYMKFIEPNIETGNQYNSPIDLDIRPGNLCNLKCRMCGPVSSSQLEKEITDNSELLSPFLGKGTIRKSDVLAHEHNIEFLLQSADKGNRIKFLGGEPTIMPEVDKFLDILIDKEYFDVPLHFTTNCTNNNKRFTDKLAKFNNVAFNYSIDGVDKVVEYIRTPVKFSTINTTVPIYNDIAGLIDGRPDVEISFTWQAYNFFNLYDTVVWAKSHGVTARPEILRVPEWDSIRSIPLSVRKPYLEYLINTFETWNDRYSKRVLPALRHALSDDVEYHPKHLARATARFDKVRNQHIKDYVPQVWDIIKEDYNDLQV